MIIIIHVKVSLAEIKVFDNNSGRCRRFPYSSDDLKWKAVALAEEIAKDLFGTHLLSLLGTAPDNYVGSTQYVFQPEYR